MWYRIVLSALAVNLAFWVPALSFFIFLFLIPLKPKLCTFGKGFWWGIFVFGPHFIWLVVLLVTKSQAPWMLACMGYLCVVGYFSLTSGVWFWATRILHRHLSFLGWGALVVSGVVYYVFIEHLSLCFVGCCEGYPFLNPLIPLAHNKLLLELIAQLGSFVRWLTLGSALVAHSLTPTDINVVYLPPVCQDVSNACAGGQRVYHALSKYHFNTSPKDPAIIVTPETFYPFSLNLHPELASLWGSLVPASTPMVIGSQLTQVKTDLFYQAAYLLKNCLINQTYVKHHCTPFVEKMPQFYKSFSFLKTLFLHDSDEFSCGDQPLIDGVFEVHGNLCLIPQICSEFFFKTTSAHVWEVCCRKLDENKHMKTALLFMVNDSWFVPYFQKIMHAVTALKAAYLGLPVIYVGHWQMCWYYSKPLLLKK